MVPGSQRWNERCCHHSAHGGDCHHKKGKRGSLTTVRFFLWRLSEIPRRNLRLSKLPLRVDTGKKWTNRYGSYIEVIDDCETKCLFTFFTVMLQATGCSEHINNTQGYVKACFYWSVGGASTQKIKMFINQLDIASLKSTFDVRPSIMQTSCKISAPSRVSFATKSQRNGKQAQVSK